MTEFGLTHRAGNPGGLGHRRRLGGLHPLRPDAGQGDLVRTDPGTRRPGARRRTGPHSAARPPHQPGPPGTGAASSAFLDGATDTAFFDTHGLDVLAAGLADERAVRLSAVAAALADAAHNRANARVLGGLASGWRNVVSGNQHKVFGDAAGAEHEVVTGSPAPDYCCPTIRVLR